MRKENDWYGILQSSDCTIKILFLGNSGAGKSCLITRFIQDRFVANFYNTIGVDFKFKNITIDETKVKMQVWDTAGQDRFKTLTSNYFRGADGVIIVFDVTETSSFEGVQGWINEMQKYTDENCQSILVGNKIDLNQRRQVTQQQAIEYAELMKIPYLETSAREGHKVQESFYKIARMILAKRLSTKGPAPRPKLELKLGSEKKDIKERQSCC